VAIIHQADLRPTKLDLLAGWLPGRSWYAGPDGAAVERVAAFRFDDPDGEVGVETLLVRVDGGPVLQVPLTYRAAPLAGADEHLVGTTDHSVLGTRWVYDACADPVYVSTLLNTMLTGGREADEMVETDSGPQRRNPGAEVRGSGGATPVTVTNHRYADGSEAVIGAGDYELRIPRVLPAGPADGAYTMIGRWSGQDGELRLATATTR
jgi:hypothetical protein